MKINRQYLIFRYSFLYFALFLIVGSVCLSFVNLQSSNFPNHYNDRSDKPKRLCVKIPEKITVHASDIQFGEEMIETGLDYIKSKTKGTVDIIHVNSNKDKFPQKEFDCIIQLNYNEKISKSLNSLDAYSVKTIKTEPIVIEVSAGSIRGLLYGLYYAGEAIESNLSLSELNIENSPLVENRIGMLTPTTCFGKHFQPDLFWRSLEEFPRLGLNGVFIIPATLWGTPAGMTSSLPLHFSGNKIETIEPDVDELRAVFRKIKAHGQDIYVLLSPMIPPNFTRKQVRDYYDGKTKLEGYESAVCESTKMFLNVLFEELPEIDGVVLHSLELGELWEGAVSIFPSENLEASISSLNAYFKGLTEACETNNKTPIFWTHIYGVNGNVIEQIRHSLLNWSSITILEDAYWPNGGWPFLPFMGYLQDSMQNQICKSNSLGIFMETTDGEYYGGGKLPIAFPERHIEAVDKAIENDAKMVFVRLNEHDETTHGTLFSSLAIMVEAATDRMWNSDSNLTEVWHRSYSKLYGEKAAAKVVNAFKQSKTIVRDGFSVGDILLLTHEGINPSVWLPGNQAFNLFRKDNKSLTEDSYPLITGGDLIRWQLMKNGEDGTMSIQEFRQKNNSAQKAVSKGLEEINSARSDLSISHFTELIRCFEDAQITVEAIKLLGEAAYSANQLIDGDTNSQHKLQQNLAASIDDLVRYADRIEQERGTGFLAGHHFISFYWKGKTIHGPSLPVTLRYISDKLKQQFL